MILILTDPAVGGTFLSWTLHYLAGHERYFNARQGEWQLLPSDPVLKNNAHGFRPNQANTIVQVRDLMAKLKASATPEFHHLYFHNLKDQPCTQTERHQPTADIISSIQSEFNSIIMLNSQNLLYWAMLEPRVLCGKFGDPTIDNTSADEQHEDFVQYFFKDSLAFWQSHALTDIWDKREFLALNLRPFSHQKIRHNLDLSVDHFYLDSMDMHVTFDQTVEHLFDSLGLKLQSGRYCQWKGVYDRWKKIHYHRILFCWHFDEIINYILHGYYMDLKRFNLDLVQEACIQHALLYRHDLNLKTFNLDKFQNTKQLNRLLEKNFHPLSAY